MKRRRFPWMSAAVAVALIAAACGGDEPSQPGAQTPTGSRGGSFSIEICEPESLVPQNDNETCGGQVLESLFTALVKYNPETSQPENAVAESIESTDQINWTIKIKGGWTFHNGEPVTAESFVDAWNWAAHGPNAAANNYFFANVEGYDALNPEEGEPTVSELSGLEVVDDTTFTVTLSAAFSQFPLTVGYNAFYPLPQAFFDDPEAFNEAPIGNGPYQMDGSWEHDQAIKVKRFPNFPTDVPAAPPGLADNVEFRIFSDIAVSYRDVQAGNLDIAGVPPEQIEAGKAEFGDRFLESPSSNFTYVGFPMDVEPFDNKALRQALSMAIDRKAITDAIFFGTRTPALSVVSPVVAGAREDPCQYCVLDVEQAKAKLQEAGGWSGPLTLWFNSGAGHEDWMEAVSNQLRQNLGIQEIRFESLEFADYLGKLDAREVTGPFRLGWVMDYPSPQNYLEPLHACGGSSNNTTYCNQQVDDLIAQGNASPTVDEGISFYQQAEDLILEDMPFIPMFFGLSQDVHSENVSNVVVDAFSFVRIELVQVVNR